MRRVAESTDGIMVFVRLARQDLGVFVSHGGYGSAQSKPSSFARSQHFRPSSHFSLSSGSCKKYKEPRLCQAKGLFFDVALSSQRSASRASLGTPHPTW